jgi:hypothetical protein
MGFGRKMNIPELIDVMHSGSVKDVKPKCSSCHIDSRGVSTAYRTNVIRLDLHRRLVPCSRTDVDRTGERVCDLLHLGTREDPHECSTGLAIP